MRNCKLKIILCASYFGKLKLKNLFSMCLKVYIWMHCLIFYQICKKVAPYWKIWSKLFFLFSFFLFFSVLQFSNTVKDLFNAQLLTCKEWILWLNEWILSSVKIQINENFKSKAVSSKKRNLAWWHENH